LAALACEAFVRAANGAAPKKVIVVPGRLVNIVV
jgi:leucyl-tRNA synthetase